MEPSMNYSARIQRQGSCGCGNICRRKYNYEELSQLCHDSNQPASNTLRCLWRKILREKKRILRKPAGNAVSAPPYDPYTYAQNFDEGPAWEEPENLARSFSARFAVPSRFFKVIELD